VMDMVLTVAQLPGDITSHVEVTTAMKLVE
jgi:hypothetical protein